MPRHFSEPFEPEDLFDPQEARRRRLNMEEVLEQNARIAEQEAAADAKRQAEISAKMKIANDRRLLRDYHAAGVEPLQVDSEGIPRVSLPMLLKIGWTIGQHDGHAVLIEPHHNRHIPKRREDYDHSS